MHKMCFMPRVAKKSTPLGQICKASGLSREEFAQMLGIPARTLASYILGARSLPPLTQLQVLRDDLGVDLESLSGEAAQMLDGSPVTTEGIKNWKQSLRLEIDDEIELAVDQLSPTLLAVLTALGEVDPYRGRLLLTKICRAIDQELQDPKTQTAAEEVLAKKIETVDRDYASGEQFLTDATELYDSTEWERIKVAIDPAKPVHLQVRNKSTLMLPWMNIRATGITDKEGEAMPDMTITGSFRKILTTYVITQGGLELAIRHDSHRGIMAIPHEIAKTGETG